MIYVLEFLFLYVAGAFGLTILCQWIDTRREK